MKIKRLATIKNLLILLIMALLLTLTVPLEANAQPVPHPIPAPSASPKAVSSTKGIVYIGLVRGDGGYLYRFSGLAAKSLGSGVSWDTCPERTKFIGRDFSPNGFWMCASSDVAGQTYHFGNVFGDDGLYYEVLDRKAKRIGEASWDTCSSGSLRGRVFDSLGFWFCQG